MTNILKKHTVNLLLCSVVGLSGCAGGGAAYTPIIDGPVTENYYQDLATCQSLAQQRRYDNADVRTNAVIGAGLGGLAALADNDKGRRGHHDEDGFEEFALGALIGAIFGGGARALETREERKHIVLNCMSGRGYRVLE